MSPRDTAHAYDLEHACRHLYRHAKGCPVCTPVEDGADGTSWDSRQHAPVARPWWRTSDGDLSWPAVLILLAVTGACVLTALVVGQRLQDTRCAAAAATPAACTPYSTETSR